MKSKGYNWLIQKKKEQKFKLLICVIFLIYSKQNTEQDIGLTAQMGYVSEILHVRRRNEF